MALFDLYELSENDKDRGVFVNTTQICYFGPKFNNPNATLIAMSNGECVRVEKTWKKVRRFIKENDRDM